ncbi:MAG: hypothetical protein MJY72_06915 [Bacteroidales bacterium]|nr:hypothetical protein [Bacteroidales bacterium]
MRIEDLYQKFKKTIDMSILLAAYMATQSCIMDERYNGENLKNMDLTMNLFSKGVEFPLGSTSQLSFADLSEISGADFSMLTEAADGSYSISYGDQIDLSENLASLDFASLASMDAIAFDEKFEYHVGIDKNMLGIQAQEWDESSEIGVSAFSIPAISPINRVENIPMGLYDESLVKSLSLDEELKDIHIKNGFVDPSMAVLGGNGPAVKGLTFFVGDIAPVTMEPYTSRILVDHELQGIKSISDIELSGNAKMIVSLSLTNNYLVSGNIVPNIDVDLTKICGIEGYSGKMVNISDLVMNEENGYRAVRTYDITGLVKNSFKDGRIFLDENVTIAGQIEGYSLTADRSLVSDSYSKGGMMLNLDVQFENVDIESADIVLEPVTVVTDDIIVPMSISPVALPSIVERISSVSLDRSRKTVLELDAPNLLKINGLSAKIDEIVVEFPDGMHVEGCTDGRLVIKGAKLPLRKDIVISSIDFPAPVAGYQSFNGNIKVHAKTTVSGSMDVADLPASESEDVVVVASISSSPVISDFSVKTNEYRKDLGMEQKFDLNVDGIGDLGNITVVPDGKPNIEIVFNTPSVQALTFMTGNDGITIALPSSIRLDESRMGSGYTYSQSKHSINILGPVPSKISLPVKEFHVSASTAEQEIKVSGEFVAAAGVLGKSDVEALNGASIGISLSIPQMNAKNVRLDDGLSVKVDETTSVSLFDRERIPEMVDILSELVLDDVYINCSMDFGGLPGNGNYMVDLVATLPDCFSPSEIALKGAVKNGRFVAQPVKLIALRNLDMRRIEELSSEITIRGSLSTESADIELESLKNDISVDMKISIADRNGKIAVSSMRGHIHQEMSYSTTLSFDDIPEFLRSSEVCLDIKNPSLMLAIRSNMGIPVNGEIELIPWRNGHPDGRVTALRDLAFPCSKDAASPELVELCLDPEQISRVFRQIPDSLEIVFKGNVDADKECIIDLGSEYFMDLAYDFDMPLTPGEDFMLVLSDTIDLSQELVDVMSRTPIGLRIAARNSMPFGLKIFVDFLDVDGNVLYISDGEISAGISGGSRLNPRVETADVMIRTLPGSPVNELAQLRISFALSGGAETHNLMKDDYIEADIKAVLPEGISFKIN